MRWKTDTKGSFMMRTASIFLILLILNRFVQLFYLGNNSTTKAPTSASSKTSSFNQDYEDSFATNDLLENDGFGDGLVCSNSLDQREPVPNKIPLTIHQAYPHPDLPEPLARLRSTWMDHHFEWEFVLWNERDLDDLIRFEFPWAFDMYSSATTFDQKVDIAKYFILLTHGGVFSDTSLMSIRNGIRLHKMGGLLLPLVNVTVPEASHSSKFKSKTTTTNYKRKYQVSNAWMASERDHPFLLFMAECLVAEFNDDIPTLGGSLSLYNAVRDFEAQRLPSDPPIHYMEQGYVVIPDSRDPAYPRECRDSSKSFNLDICAEKLMTVDTIALSYRTTFDLKL